jgi:hypothetical protein
MTIRTIMNEGERLRFSQGTKGVGNKAGSVEQDCGTRDVVK